MHLLDFRLFNDQSTHASVECWASNTDQRLLGPSALIGTRKRPKPWTTQKSRIPFRFANRSNEPPVLINLPSWSNPVVEWQQAQWYVQQSQFHKMINLEVNSRYLSSRGLPMDQSHTGDTPPCVTRWSAFVQPPKSKVYHTNAIGSRGSSRPDETAPLVDYKRIIWRACDVNSRYLRKSD